MVNADVFYVNWTNIQQSVNLPICGASITLNVGAAATYGGELEVRAKIIGGLSATFVGGVTRAYITASPNDQTAYPGQWLLNVPAWSATPAFEYDWPLANGNGFVRSDYDLIGDSRGSFSLTDPAYDQPGYGVLNASIGIRHDSFTLGLYAKNLADSAKIITRPSINFVEEAYTLRPLTAGIYATLKL
jgi:outer membrane receptor protein involved in Fe transport